MTVQTHPLLPFQTILKELPTYHPLPLPRTTCQSHHYLQKKPQSTPPSHLGLTHFTQTQQHPGSMTPLNWSSRPWTVLPAKSMACSWQSQRHLPPAMHPTSLPAKMPHQTCHQNLDPQQTHHCHQNHTKHRHLLSPPLPIPHPNFSRHLSFPVNICPPHLPPIPCQQLSATVMLFPPVTVSVFCASNTPPRDNIISQI